MMIKPALFSYYENGVIFLDIDKILIDRKRKKIRRKILIFFIFFFILSLTLLIYADMSIFPLIKESAKQRARSLCAYIISESVTDRLSRDDISYDSLVTLEKDTQGKITALTTDIVSLNRLKAHLSSDILEKLSDTKSSTIYIPLGNVVGNSYFSGRGPRIEITLVPAGSVLTDITNVFSSAGINQTRHQMMLEVKVNMTILLPRLTIHESVKSSICVAETVIVGSVPEAFTNVESGGYGNIADDIIDFGAENFID